MKPLNNNQPDWTASPSQYINAGYFWAMAIAAVFLIAAAVFLNRSLHPQSLLAAATTFSIVLIPLAMAGWRYANTRVTRYTMRDQRLFFQRGILNRTTHQIELFRIRDFVLDEPIALRLFGLSNVQVISADVATPNLQIHAIRNGASVVSMLRESVMDMRQQYNVREVEMGGG